MVNSALRDGGRGIKGAQDSRFAVKLDGKGYKRGRS